MKIFGNITELGSLIFRNSTNPYKQVTLTVGTVAPTSDIEIKLPDDENAIPVAISDTLVGKASKQTLTNKTLSSPTISGGTFSSASWTGGTISGATITGGTVSSLSSDIAVTDGGTGLGALTLNGILFGNATAALGVTAAGTQYQVLQAGVSGVPTFGALNLSQAAARTGTLPVGNGGTGITSGNAGGVPYFSSDSTLASSIQLIQNGVVLGGSLGPFSTSAGSAYSVFRVPSSGGVPAFGAINLSQTAAVTGTLNVQQGGTGATSNTLNGVMLGNGTSAVITSNAGAAYQTFRVPSVGGMPSFGALDISQAAATTGLLPIASGGTNANTAATARTSLGAAASGANTDITSLAATGDVAGATLSATGLAGNGYLTLAGQSASPAAPAPNAIRLYAQTVNKKLVAETDNGAEYHIALGGQGEFNAIANPNDTYNGWTSGTAGQAASTLTSDSLLAPFINTAIRLTASADELSPGFGKGIIYSFTMPPALLTTKVKLEFYAQTPSTDRWVLQVFAAGIQVPLSTDVAGITDLPDGFTGKVTAYFDAGTATSYTVNFARVLTTAGTTTATINNLLVGPGVQAQTASVGNWTTFPITGTSTSFSSGIATASAYGKYRRVGDSADFYVYLPFNGPATPAGVFRINLPLGLTIDSSKINTAQFVQQVGVVEITTAAGGQGYTGQLLTNGNTTSVTAVYQSAVTGAQSGITNAAPLSLASGNFITASWSVPIAGWSSTVNVGQNDEEYMSHDGTQTVYGADGWPVPNIASGGANQQFVMTLPTPTLADTRFTVEFRTNAVTTWVPAEDIFPVTNQAGVTFGAQISSSTTNTVTVLFGGGGAKSTNLDYGDASTSTSWASALGTGARWRLRKQNAGAAIGFGLVRPGLSSGLVPSAGFPANATGALTTSGFVGEVAQSTVLNPTATGASATYWDATNISFAARTPGVFLVTGTLTWTRNAATITSTDLALSITAIAGNVAPVAGQIGQSAVEDSTIGTSATFTRRSVTLPSVVVQWTGTQLIFAGVTATANILYLKAYTGAFSAGIPQYGARLTAVRIA